MSETHYIKQNDTAPILTKSLKNADDSAVDLTGATVKIHVNTRLGVNIIDAVMIIPAPATDGIVTHEFAALTAANYDVEYEVTYASTKIETFPQNGYDLLVAERDLK